MRKEQLRTYISNKDANLLQLSDKRKAKIKKQRAKLRDLQKKTLRQAKNARTTARNINTLTKGQKKRFEKRYKKIERARKRLKYKNNGGAIGFENVLNEGNWVNNFVSSNVRAFRVKGQNLLIQFLDGSVYIYFRVGKKFLGLFNAGSKGKWVWNKLRRQNVNYAKIR